MWIDVDRGVSLKWFRGGECRVARCSPPFMQVPPGPKHVETIKHSYQEIDFTILPWATAQSIRKLDSLRTFSTPISPKITITSLGGYITCLNGSCIILCVKRKNAVGCGISQWYSISLSVAGLFYTYNKD